MPDIVTHATFARDVIEQLNNPNAEKILNKHKSLLYLGAQGPDVFYFNSYIKKKDKKRDYRQFGNVMHDHNVDDFLYESIKYLKSNYHEELYTYIIGFLCHHALDSRTHPYVYYVTGIYNHQKPHTHSYRGNHMRLERAIDSLFIQKYWGEKNPHRFKIYKKVLGYRINRKLFGPYFNRVIKKSFNKEDGGKVFIKSSKNFKGYLKLLYDPIGFKKKIAKHIDKTYNRKSKLVIETLFHHHNINEEIDYLNLNHQEWKHPITQETSNKSFVDLYNDGIIEVIKLIEVVENFLKDKISEEELVNHIPNTSYSTGIDWHRGNKMIHFDVIL